MPPGVAHRQLCTRQALLLRANPVGQSPALLVDNATRPALRIPPGGRILADLGSRPSDTTAWQNVSDDDATMLAMHYAPWTCSQVAMYYASFAACRSLTRCLPPTAPLQIPQRGRRLADLGSRPSNTTAWQNVSEICDCACSALGPCSYPQVARCYASFAACRVPPPPRWLGLFLAGSAHLPPQRRMRRSQLRGDPPFHAPAGGRTLADPTTCPSIPP